MKIGSGKLSSQVAVHGQAQIELIETKRRSRSRMCGCSITCTRLRSSNGSMASSPGMDAGRKRRTQYRILVDLLAYKAWKRTIALGYGCS
jgi:hypothetical protein